MTGAEKFKPRVLLFTSIVTVSVLLLVSTVAASAYEATTGQQGELPRVKKCYTQIEGSPHKIEIPCPPPPPPPQPDKNGVPNVLDENTSHPSVSDGVSIANREQGNQKPLSQLSDVPMFEQNNQSQEEIEEGDSQ